MKARTSTNVGFLIMFQSILILQGAKVQVKFGEMESRYRFEVDYADEKPLGLERLQVKSPFEVCRMRLLMRKRTKWQ